MFESLKRSFSGLKIGVTFVNILASLYLVLFANLSFWRELYRRLQKDSSGQLLFLVVIGISMVLIFNLLLTLFSFKPVHKPLLILVFIVASVVSYYMDSYGIVIDKQMITNLLETDVNEASEQLSWPFFRHILLMGGFPSMLLAMTKINYHPWRRELMKCAGIILISLIVLAVLLMSNFKELALFGRQNKVLRMYINPTYPLYSLVKTVKINYQAKQAGPVKVIAPDATRVAKATRTAVVLVVGETARAEQFSLNGYGRDTNPELRSRNVFNFNDVQACGTDTAESLPCMFFHLGRSNYSRSEAKQYENLLDVLQRTGVKVLWRDNNSGSKGVADRVNYETMADAKDGALCSSGECLDEILLKGLDSQLDSNAGDMLVVLHQKGSHGPSYYKRSPKEFEKFLPECTQDNVQECDRQSIINAYDNTIVYTDHVLGKLIDMLKNRNYATAMLYVSDHGESLGENNIYLHGLPYSIAPKQQTQVPMVFWASRQFLSEKKIDPLLLEKEQAGSLSHDNLFHSMLGLFNVKTELYRKDLDLFRPARSGKP